MTLTITPIYAALLTALYIYLSFRVIGHRRGRKISLGDGDDPAMRAKARVHANFAEYTPFALVLLLMIEIQGAPGWVLHGIGLMLLIGRVAHAWGTSQHPQIMPLRVWGMILTFSAIGGGALAAMWLALA